MKKNNNRQSEDTIRLIDLPEVDKINRSDYLIIEETGVLGPIQTAKIKAKEFLDNKVDVIDSLESDLHVDSALSAKQGKVLNSTKIDQIKVEDNKMYLFANGIRVADPILLPEQPEVYSDFDKPSKHIAASTELVKFLMENKADSISVEGTHLFLLANGRKINPEGINFNQIDDSRVVANKSYSSIKVMELLNEINNSLLRIGEAIGDVGLTEVDSLTNAILLLKANKIDEVLVDNNIISFKANGVLIGQPIKITSVNDNSMNTTTTYSSTKIESLVKDVETQVTSIVNSGHADSEILNIVDRYEVEYCNVKDFGCKCDGITDDTVGLQKAIEYAINNKLSILIPGKMTVTKSIKLKDLLSGEAPNISLIGIQYGLMNKSKITFVGTSALFESLTGTRVDVNFSIQNLDIEATSNTDNTLVFDKMNFISFNLVNSNIKNFSRIFTACGVEGITKIFNSSIIDFRKFVFDRYCDLKGIDVFDSSIIGSVSAHPIEQPAVCIFPDFIEDGTIKVAEAFTFVRCNISNCTHVFPNEIKDSKFKDVTITRVLEIAAHSNKTKFEDVKIVDCSQREMRNFIINVLFKTPSPIYTTSKDKGLFDIFDQSEIINSNIESELTAYGETRLIKSLGENGIVKFSKLANNAYKYYEDAYTVSTSTIKKSSLSDDEKTLQFIECDFNDLYKDYKGEINADKFFIPGNRVNLNGVEVESKPVITIGMSQDFTLYQGNIPYLFQSKNLVPKLAGWSHDTNVHIVPDNEFVYTCRVKNNALKQHVVQINNIQPNTNYRFKSSKINKSNGIEVILETYSVGGTLIKSYDMDRASDTIIKFSSAVNSVKLKYQKRPATNNEVYKISMCSLNIERPNNEITIMNTGFGDRMYQDFNANYEPTIGIFI